jgi:hypothetical protein
MTKIGRNDPRPCGSGKKYKHRWRLAMAYEARGDRRQAAKHYRLALLIVDEPSDYDPETRALCQQTERARSVKYPTGSLGRRPAMTHGHVFPSPWRSRDIQPR